MKKWYQDDDGVFWLRGVGYGSDVTLEAAEAMTIDDLAVELGRTHESADALLSAVQDAAYGE